MAWIKTYETKDRKRGKRIRTYRVIWKEVERDSYGLPIPVDPQHPEGRKRTRNRQESFATREDAEARRDELNAAKHTGQTSALAEQKKAGDLPFGYYAQAWIESQQLKVAQGRLKQRTLDGYEKEVKCYLLPPFGSKAIAAITPKDCEQFLTSLVGKRSRQNGGKPVSPGTVKHAWGTLRRVMKYAMQHGAIVSNPCDRVDYDGGRATGDREKFQHHPLTAEQVGRVSAAVAGNVDGLPAYSEYALMVEFLAYSGLRASENSGLEIGDLEFITRPGQATRCTVSVRRTKDRKGGEWVTTTPKSRKSRRTVPLPPWLSEKMRAYVADHPRADEPAAPLWPSRTNGGGHRAAGERYAVPLDWSQPLFMGTFYESILKPALEAAGLPASRPATNTAPAQQGVRLHDLRHTFAVMQLMAGVHFMQVSRWMGHSTFTLTLDTYGDWIPEEDGGALSDLPEPSALQVPAEPEPSNVVQLFGR
ncbi:tyrosine-type recombinase/integrase [Gordonia sp. NPDC058843]|uniref:tyrosine-type recombinase/integrase n=1 Tax=Gordonia sp. NPDC058843 TaxID=3346648 RepID=UPI003674AB0E